MSRNIEALNNQFRAESLNNQPEIFTPLSVELFYTDNPQAKLRHQLYQEASSLFNQITDVHLDFDNAIDQRQIKPEQVSDFYDHLSNFIQMDPNHTRLILYLPFQVLPSSSKDHKQSSAFTLSQERFVRVYRDAWIQQLFESSFRADFVDGDFSEPGLPAPSTVRKAAHLIPELLNRGIIHQSTIDEIIEANPADQELIDSLQSGLDASKFQPSSSDSPNYCLSNFKDNLSHIEQMFCSTSDLVSSQSLKEKYDPGCLPDTKISPQRAAWRLRVLKEELFKNTAQQITDPDLIDSLLCTRDSEVAYKILGLRSIFNQDALSQKHDSLIKWYWFNGNNQIKNTIITGLNCLQRRGVVGSDYLSQFGISLPDLSSPLPVDLDILAQRHFDNLGQAVNKIQSDKELLKSVYPVFLAFGSRVKGYSGFDSDQDVAVFFRPDADLQHRDSILSRLNSFPELSNICKLSEVWTGQRGDRLSFRHIESKTWTMIKPDQIHFIFNGVWIGDTTDSKKLREDFLSAYLDLSRFGRQKADVRFSLLRQLESDILQCRLLHKGYYSFYPDQKPVGVSELSSIDGNSAFWDPGYRRVATQLFLSRVFLPDLSK